MPPNQGLFLGPQALLNSPNLAWSSSSGDGANLDIYMVFMNIGNVGESGFFFENFQEQQKS